MKGDRPLTEEEQKEMLSDEETVSDLKKIHHIRNEIQFHTKIAEQLHQQQMELIISIQKKHKFNFHAFIGIIMLANNICKDPEEKKKDAEEKEAIQKTIKEMEENIKKRKESVAEKK
jgi:hypothetical protein